MSIDLELYRHEVIVSKDPMVRLSAIDISPESPLHTMVFIHGFGGQALQWEYQLVPFSVKNRVIAIDLRGHGQSDKPVGTYAMSQIIADLESALQALGVPETFVLLGHSFGGAVATEYAARHPNRVDHLVLIASAGEFKLNLPTRLTLSLPLPLLRLAEPFVHQWLHAPVHVLQAWYRNNLSPWNGWSLLRNIETPTLVIRGNRDVVLKAPLFEEVARALPNAEDVNVGSSGHLVMLERRQAVNRAIERFLDAQPRSWRESTDHQLGDARTDLIAERPWLKQYEPGVPYTIAIPEVPLHQFLSSAVGRFPLRAAIDYEGRRISYRQLDGLVNQLAHRLRAMGIRKGDRILLLMPDIPQLVISFYGALKAGVVPVFSLLGTGEEELIREVRDSEPKAIIAVNELAELVCKVETQTGARQGGTLEHLIFTDPLEFLPPSKKLVVRFKPELREACRLSVSLGEGRHLFTDLLDGQPRIPPEQEVTSSDLAVIVYTGGTTAAPKGVMLSHRNLVANTLQTRHWMPEAQEGKEKFLCVLPFAHIYGLTTALNLPIALGATLILKPRFELEDVLTTIRKTRPTIFPGVPRMYVAISDYPGVRRFGIRSIKACLSGSAPLAVETQEGFEKLTRGRLVEGYGLTEASPVTHANPLNGLRKVGSIGIPLPSTEAKVFDLATGTKEAPVNQIGELAVRGPQVMMGYWRNPKATDKVFTTGGWLLTGDVAQVDADGYFRIVARKADMWYPSKPDLPAFPRDVEEVLVEVPQVREAAVVAIAGQPIAFVIAQKKRPSADELIAYCRRRLPPELVPRLVIFLDDFPRTFIGKVLRRELAKRYRQKQLGASHLV